MRSHSISYALDSEGKLLKVNDSCTYIDVNTQEIVIPHSRYVRAEEQPILHRVDLRGVLLCLKRIVEDPSLHAVAVPLKVSAFR